MLDRLLDGYARSTSPTVAGLRDFVRARPNLRRAGRSVLLVVRALVGAPRRLKRVLRGRPIGPSVTALSEARAAGGPLSVGELERLWNAAAYGRCAVVVGADNEAFRQISVLFRKKNIETINRCESPAELAQRSAELPKPGVVAVLPPWDVAAVRQQLGRRWRNATVLELVPSPNRIGYRARPSALIEPMCKGGAASPLQRKLSAGEPLRIAMLNDVGFLYGAGVAARRQAASFLLNGWHVEMAAWSPNQGDIDPYATGIADFERWHGVRGLRHVHADAGLSDEEIAAALVSAVRSMEPDLVIVGNIHGASWPLGILPAIRALGVETVVYMHDCYWVTGRCAHAGPCQLFLTGCDETCPTAHFYPRLAPAKIPAAWRVREEIFTGADAIPLVGNSRWTRDFVRKRFGDRARTTVVHLGLDHHLFTPIAKAAARRLIGVPDDKTVVLMGAVNIRDPYKGGPLFRALHQALLARDDVAVTLFGRDSEELACAKSFGFVTDERLMPFIYSAADIFVNTATAESFGQTILEAHACGVPAVAIDVGGVSDVVVDGETGILVKRHTPADLIAAVDNLIADKAVQRRMGEASRRRVEQLFTLDHQADRWIDFLKAL